MLLDPSMAKLLSNVLLSIPVLVFLWYFYKRDYKKAMTFLSAYLFLSGVVLLTKFVLKVPRPEGAETSFDPYSFPSFHTAYASLLFFLAPNVWTLLYAVLVGYLRVLAGVHRWVDVFGGFLFAWLSWWLYKKGKERVGFEWDRQAFHMGSGALLGLLFYIDWKLGLALLAVALIFGAIIYHERERTLVKPFLDFFDRDGTGKGAFLFVLGVFVAAAINHPWAWVATWYLAYVDSTATMVGKYFRTKGKSIYGTLGGFIAGILVAIATETPLWLPLVVSLTELFPYVDDNLSIPVVVAIVGRLIS
jgi:dolichol kinase